MDNIWIIPYLLLPVLVFFEFIFPIHQTGLRESVKHYLINSFFYLSSKILFLFMAPLILVSFEIYEIGVFNALDLNPTLETILSLILLDFVVWLQHYLTHEIGLLWKLHRVHHSDTILDCSSAVRFHPFELCLSLIYKISFCMILGINYQNYILFEIILVTFAIFGHSNYKINEKISRVIEFVFITPRLHQIHHSNKNHEMNSNFGTILNLWDRLFKRFITSGEVQAHFELGLKGIEKSEAQKLSFLFTYPFK